MPAAVQNANAVSDASVPNDPTVSGTGPSIVFRISPGAASPPETMPEKIADWV